jgi:N-acetylmuramic acid 6-phosphate etherase
MKRNLVWFYLFLAPLILFATSSPLSSHRSSQESQSISEKKPTLLKLLDIMPSPESIDFVQEKTQFQLHDLPAEQRHPKTWNLSERIDQDLEAGFHMLFSVDEDIIARLGSLEKEEKSLEMTVRAAAEAILTGHKIYIFGGEETGRWTKQVESSLWRPFWRDLKENRKIWSKLSASVGDSIEDRLIGEMPGADRSLIHPLAGLDDLMLFGRLQLVERGIEPGDVVICVSGSGVTPAVIGTISEAFDQWKKRYPYDAEKIRKRFFFFLNDPEEALLSFDHVRAVMEEPGITKIDLTTGPQALTGSLRLQASTIDDFVVGNIIQAAVDQALRQVLSDKEMEHLGFGEPVVITEKLGEFSKILKKVERIIPSIARLSLWEENAYREGHTITYSALKGLSTVFNDCAERSSTFFLPPLDSVQATSPKSRIQVWALKEKQEEAWLALLGRPFRGLSSPSYEKKIEGEIIDPALKHSALESLKNAGEDQQFLYDFAFSENNRRKHGPKKDDFGILVVLSPEEEQIDDEKSDFYKFLSDFSQNGAKTGLLFLTENSEEEISKLVRKIPGFDPEANALVVLTLEEKDDPMGLKRQIALKIILNAHSTAVMARTGKVIGNSVFDFSPENFKSVDRATYLIQSYVNDILQRPQWVKQHGIQKPVSFGEANAILYDSIAYMKENMGGNGQSQAVGLSIVRVLESLRLNRAFSPEEALSIIQKEGLESYLKDVANQKP